MTTSPIATSVFHPTDFTPASERAFAHALAIAVASQARLDIFHAGRSPVDDWEKFPRVRRTLERWELMPLGSPRSAVFERLRVSVMKAEEGGRPVRACLRVMRRRDPDLIVLSTEGRKGLVRWLRPSVAEAMASRTRAATLFVPASCSGFVSSIDGAIVLDKILVPVADDPLPNSALHRAEGIARALASEGSVITALRVNGAAPSLPDGTSDGPSWAARATWGDVVDEILQAASAADLIVMATRGTHGLWDALRGSTTSRVLQSAPCPVLAVHAS